MNRKFCAGLFLSLFATLTGFAQTVIENETTDTSPGSSTTPFFGTAANATWTNFQYYNNISYDVTNTTSALSIHSVGGTSQTSGGIADFTNNGGSALTLENTVTQSQYTEVLSIASDGGSSSSSADAGSGGSVNGYNYATISVTGSFNSGLSLIDISSTGGSGGSNNGGNGGGGSSVTLQNYGTLLAGSSATPISGSSGFRLVSAYSWGGAAGNAENGNPGGGAGFVTINNQANGAVYYTAVNTSGTTSVYGLYAQSLGGVGGAATESGKDGGNGGQGGGIQVTHSNATITMVGNTGTTSQVLSGGAIVTQSTGANGGRGADSSDGGAGGSTSNNGSTVTVTDGSLLVTGDYLAGISMTSQGGVGGEGGDNKDHSNAGPGGSTGFISASITSQDKSAQISTNGVNAPAVTLNSLGGAGGLGTTYNNPTFGVGDAQDGGNAGTAGAITFTLSGSSTNVSTLSTSGANSPGVFALSQGGTGGAGGLIEGQSSFSSTGSTGGTGGNGGAITITNGNGTGGGITTSGNDSVGIHAQSQGGVGGAAGQVNSIGNSGENGATGGSTGAIQITNSADSYIRTSGQGSPAIVAQSMSGGGGAGGAVDNDGGGTSGDGGTGGNTSTVQVTNDGLISTTGPSSAGIIAQANSGAGGSAGAASGWFYAGGGDGGSSGSLGQITVTQSAAGSITTSGDNSSGIILQSVAGGGGAAGNASGGIVTIGGSNTSNPYSANGGATVVTGNGSVTTTGQSAIAVLSQSIGGGGGDAGSSSGWITIGGSGGAGGTGGNSAVNFVNGGSLSTSGQLSHAIVSQSVGGGGGNAGNATSLGFEVAVGIGGTGGQGGNAGEASITMGTSSSPTHVTTTGSNSAGLVTQSIGGGGGSGGSAYATSGGVGFSAAAGIGGSGGSGGAGGTSSVSISYIDISTGSYSTTPSNTQAVDSYGIIAQSIGGGGGVGGSASAKALAAAIPIPETDTMISASVAGSIGGSGGSGGAGGTATVLLGSNVNLQTQGQGSHGLLIQSIGGGGGAGGDSSSLAATLGYDIDPSFSLGLDIGFAVGGDGGSGGNGGNAELVIGGTSPTSQTGPASIVTYGDYANGALVQSIGGGGGNAGFGSSNSKDRGSTVSVGVNVGLGGTGGNGGSSVSTDGGPTVEVTLLEESSITTYGSGSAAIIAQSVAGGGGASQGGSINLDASGTYSGDDDGGDGGDGEEAAAEDEDDGDTELSASVTLNLGANGSDGGTAGSVLVTAEGTIVTMGGDATGILAQSIGGGGGLGGSAGSDGSADNQVDPSTGQRDSSDSDDSDADDSSYSADFELSLGGSGGSGGNGGSVTVDFSGNITTLGDWAQGIAAQSIGGGGGKGGTAVAQGSDSTPTIDIQLGIGGSGGGAGSGAGVGLNVGGGTLSTAGYAAFGILGQSIGGGGGLGADGSSSATGLSANSDGISLGGAINGSGGASGNGSIVTLDGENQKLTVTTTGEAAHAIVLQSIGGGGGVAGAGSSYFDNLSSADSTIDLAVGGGSGSSGGGNTVTIENAVLDISTTGLNAFGILAQSIGGGGGLAFRQSGSSGGASFGGEGSSGNGGLVNITLASGSSITTTGDGAHAIIAQSIGGGGGFLGYPSSSTPTLSTSLPPRGTVSGYGSNVSLNIDAEVQTSGNAAYGIIAQSLGGGGGILAVNNLQFGTTGSSTSDGAGGQVSVTQAGSIQTTGTNSIGIFAQSAGVNEESGLISITVNGNVVGGSGTDGWGIWVDSGANSGNSVTVSSTGSVSAASGNAINYSGFGLMNVTNNGVVSGNVSLKNAGGGSGTYTNNATQIAASPDDAVTPMASGRGRGLFSRTVIDADFVQTKKGSLVVRTDFDSGRGDQFIITGDAKLDGRLVGSGFSVDPTVQIPVLRVKGKVTGELDVVLYANESRIFQYGLERRGKNFLLGAVEADFNTEGFDRNPNAVGNHLSAIWANNPSETFARLFRELDSAAVLAPDLYNAYIQQMSPGMSFEFAARRASESVAYIDSVLDTGFFEETSGSWAKTSGQTVKQSGNAGLSDFYVNRSLTQVAGQAEFADNWFVGLSGAYQYSWASAENGFSSGNGHTGFGALTLKHQKEAWLFSAAVYGSFGFFETERKITIPGFAGEAEGSPDVYSAGFLAKAAYTFGAPGFYVRPSVSLNTVYVYADSYTESGAGALNLSVDSADELTFVATPAIEIGGEFEGVGGRKFRPFLLAGIDLSTSDEWNQNARFAGASTEFDTVLPMDAFTARIRAGVEVSASENLSFGIQYDGEFSEDICGNGGSLRASWKW